MKLFIILLALIAYAYCWSDEEWNDFKTKHKKFYPDSKTELERKKIWISNCDYVYQHNAYTTKNFKLDENEFADWTLYELNKRLNGLKLSFKQRDSLKASLKKNVKRQAATTTISSTSTKITSKAYTTAAKTTTKTTTKGSTSTTKSASIAKTTAKTTTKTPTKPSTTKTTTKTTTKAVKSLPSAVDWRKVPSVVSSIKNQGSCGSCWAFSSIGALEGQWVRKYGFKNDSANAEIDFSEQNLVDCTPNSFGCNGGLMTHAFQYIKKSGGVNSEAVYPYAEKTQICKFKANNIAANITSSPPYVEIPADENAITRALAEIGPVSAAVDASTLPFLFYKSGIFNDTSCLSSGLNHAILIVGYGTDNASGIPYYIIKNSWGTSWGDNGYMYLARNQNMCGISLLASYPVV